MTTNHNERSEVKLEPCPFCGAQPKLIEIPVEVHYYVMCIECGACGSDLHGRQDAINAWNTRRASAAAREWMNTWHGAFATNKEREDALVAILSRWFGGGGETEQENKNA